MEYVANVEILGAVYSNILVQTFLGMAAEGKISRPMAGEY